MSQQPTHFPRDLLVSGHIPSTSASASHFFRPFQRGLEELFGWNIDELVFVALKTRISVQQKPLNPRFGKEDNRRSSSESK
jgi:hypothetical protein